MTDAQEYLYSAKAKYDDLHRATQALHDAAVNLAVAQNRPAAEYLAARNALVGAAEDYAEAYLRG